MLFLSSFNGAHKQMAMLSAFIAGHEICANNSCDVNKKQYLWLTLMHFPKLRLHWEEGKQTFLLIGSNILLNFPTED